MKNSDSQTAAQDISNSLVLNKYHSAAEIANKAISLAVNMCTVGTDIYHICKTVDTFIEQETQKIFNKKGKKMEKGISFPTCVTVNENCAYNSPLKDESSKLSDGDVVKVELGCHVDGYIGLVGHTVIVCSTEDMKIVGKKADVVMCAHKTAEIIATAIKIGVKNTHITKLIDKTASQYHCTPVMGTYSHKLKRHIIDETNVIYNKPHTDEKMEEFQFQANEVYEINVVISTGNGKLKETDLRTTVFRRAVETNYTLKSALARNFIATVNKQFPLLPFSLNSFEDEKQMKFGSASALQHKLITPYQIMTEKSGEYIAMFKFTVLLLPGGLKKITGIAFNQSSQIQPNYEIQDQELLDLFNSTTIQDKKKKPTNVTSDISQNDDNNKMEVDA